MARRNFFIWASGGNRKIINQLDEALRPTEVNKFTGIGVSVCFTSIMAIISATFALKYIVKDEAGNPNWLAAFAFGLFWGAFIFFLDRTLVSSVKKTQSAKKNFLVMIPRMLLALIFAFIISKPLEIELFRHAFQTIEDKVAEDATGSLGIRIDSLTMENGRMRDEIDKFDIDEYSKIAKRRFEGADSVKKVIVNRNDFRVRQINDEINALVKTRRSELGVSSRNEIDQLIRLIPVDSLRTPEDITNLRELQTKRIKWNEYANQIIAKARERRPFEKDSELQVQRADSFQTAYLQVESQGDSYYRTILIPKNQQRIGDNESRIANLRKERDTRKAEFKGLWADLRAYNEYKKERPTIKIAGTLIFVLLLAFEMAPILTKMAFPFSQYDRTLQHLDGRKTIIKSETERLEDKEDRINHQLEPQLQRVLEKHGESVLEVLEGELVDKSAEERLLNAKDLIRKVSDDDGKSRAVKKLESLNHDHNLRIVQWVEKRMNEAIEKSTENKKEQEVFEIFNKFIKKHGKTNLLSSKESIDYAEKEKLYRQLKKFVPIEPSQDSDSMEDDWGNDSKNSESSFFQRQVMLDFFAGKSLKPALFLLVIPVYFIIAFFANAWPFNGQSPEKDSYQLDKEYVLYDSPSMQAQAVTGLSSDMQMYTRDTLFNYMEMSGSGEGLSGNWIKVDKGSLTGWIFDSHEQGLGLLTFISPAKVYESPNDRSKVIATTNQGEVWLLGKAHGPLAVISIGGQDIEDQWLFIGKGPKQGWVFGYFTDQQRPRIISDNKPEVVARVKKPIPVQTPPKQPAPIEKNPADQKTIANDSTETSAESSTNDPSSAEPLVIPTEVKADITKPEETTDSTSTVKSPKPVETSERAPQKGEEMIASGQMASLFKTKAKVKKNASDLQMRIWESCRFIKESKDLYQVDFNGEKYWVNKADVKLKKP